MQEAMRALRDKIQVGWTVFVVDHRDFNESRTGVVTKVEDSGAEICVRKPWESQGRTFPTTWVSWTGSDREAKYTIVRVYQTPPKGSDKSRVLALTYVFEPPR